MQAICGTRSIGSPSPLLRLLFQTTIIRSLLESCCKRRCIDGDDDAVVSSTSSASLGIYYHPPHCLVWWGIKQRSGVHLEDG